MLLRDVLDKIHGFRFMIENLDIRSGIGREMLYTSAYLKGKDEIGRQLEQLNYVEKYTRDPLISADISSIRHKLSQVKDIRGTTGRALNAQLLDDIELFEIKSFSLLCSEISGLIKKVKLDRFELPDLSPVTDILDPDRTRIPHFYIYDSYSPELKELRNRIKQLSRKSDRQEQEIQKYYAESLEWEDRIREMLSQQLQEHANALILNISILAELDVLLAKAQQATELNLCEPKIAEDTVYSGLFNPQIRKILNESGKDFQAVDLAIPRGASLITGANMAGKTVILKTTALSQALFQFGFYVPAASASIAPVDDIALIAGDAQDELHGLSSFAAEMLTLNTTIQRLRKGEELLILIDEPARTTNPAEGKALVNALLDLFTSFKVRTIITSHYSGLQIPCRTLRVKGFKGQPTERITIHNINDYMDYSLIEETRKEVPHEALYIAGILGVDGELLKKAGHYLHTNK